MKEQKQAFLYPAACAPHNMGGKTCNFGYSSIFAECNEQAMAMQKFSLAL